ncbi:MAG: zinc metallopeptidase [Verrucomicrobiales bacterium]|nr:zinc metallopeptidase [Verrucomicrobiales bacterium]
MSVLAMIPGIDPIYLVIIGGTMLLSFLVSNTMKSRFDKYSKTRIPVTGREVAEMMLRENGITDVRVVSVPGQLTDHYNPLNKTVNLSEPVYHQNSIAAAAVAAHECGHAVQHKRAYPWLTLRSKMVPAVNIANQVQNVLMMLFIFGFFITQSPMLIWAMVACLAAVALFSIVTLPVEFDASNRALAWIESSGLSSRIEHDEAKNALFWAAMTYVVAALSSVAMLVYWLSIALGRRD